MIDQVCCDRHDCPTCHRTVPGAGPLPACPVCQSLDVVVAFASGKQAAEVGELRTQRRTAREMKRDSSDLPRTNAGSTRRRCGGETQLDALDGLPDAFVARSRTVLRDNGGGRR